MGPFRGRLGLAWVIAPLVVGLVLVVSVWYLLFWRAGLGAFVATGGTQSGGVENGKIAFTRAAVSRGREVSDIYAMDADGVGVTRLRRAPAPARPLSWSSDGRRIALVMKQDGTEAIHVMKADGSGLRRLPIELGEAAEYCCLAWAPDGKRFAFTALQPLDRPCEELECLANIRTYIYTANADGTGTRRITDGPHDGAPTWRPDGTIAFLRIPNPRRPHVGIYVMKDDGSSMRRVGSVARGIELSSWSQDGRHLAVVESGDLYVMNADGSGLRRVIAMHRAVAADKDDALEMGWEFGYDPPVWSPDGRVLLFVGHGEDGTVIFAVNVDGSHARKLTEGLEPAWQPVPAS